MRSELKIKQCIIAVNSKIIFKRNEEKMKKSGTRHVNTHKQRDFVEIYKYL